VQTEKGKLVRWIEDKGFGFIKPETGGNDIFIHISALRGMSRNPVVGDTILYQTEFDSGGKIRAIDASIEGVSKQLTLEPVARNLETLVKPSQYDKPYQYPRPRAARPKKRLIGLPFLLLIVGCIYAYDRFINRYVGVSSLPDNQPIAEQSIPKQHHFQCQGKIYCSQMTSREEAEFYLHNCPGTQMDGDGDGIPCERQF
jgi:cold shock CspA family protein